MNNYMNKVAEILGVEIGEWFKIGVCYYKFNEDCLVDIDGYTNDLILRNILNGQYTIVKLPWKPKNGENYDYIGADGHIYTVQWGYFANDYYRFNAKNCFKLNTEITEEVKERILKEMKGEYNND